MAIVTKDVCRERADRIHAFVDEVRRYIYNECFDRNVSVVAIDCFCHDMFLCMNRTTNEYTFLELLRMLQSNDFMDEVFSRYLSAVR